MSGHSHRTATADKDKAPVVRNGSDVTIGTNTNDRDQKFSDTEGGGIRDDEKKQGEGGMGGFLGGIAESVAAVLNPQNTQMDDIPQDLLESLGDGTVLRFAFNPTDMEALALGDERRALEAVGDILTVNNPSKEVMEYLLGSEKFTDLVWSGHGSEDGLFTTGADGKGDLMDNEVIAGMLEESSIEEVFFAVCDGGRKLDDMVNDAGIDTYAYNRKVGDDEAMQDLQDFVTGGELTDVEGRTIEIPNFAMGGFGMGGFGMGGMGGYGMGGYGTTEINIGGQHQMGDASKRQERRQRNLQQFAEKHPKMAALMGITPAQADPGKEPAAPNSTQQSTAPGPPAPQPAPVPPPRQGRSSFDQAATGFNLGGRNYR